MSKRIFVATYGILMSSKEMARCNIDSHVVAKGVIENYDLEFRGLPSSPNGQPTIIEKDDQEPGFQVPVLIWSVASEHEAMLDNIEQYNIGQCVKKYLPVTAVALSAEGVMEGVPSDQLTALVYIPDGERISRQLTLTDFNILFAAYFEHGISSTILDLTAVAAKAAYEERAYEYIKEELKTTPLAGENPELVSRILIAKHLLEINGVNFRLDRGDENCNS